MFTPAGHQATDNRPAIVFFFGGGWVDGSPSHFHPQCEYLASRGMVAISAQYRVRSQHGITPQECVKDGKSAIRYIRQHAAELGVDPNRIAAGGGSAGGHVAAATGILTAYDEPGENLSISSKPNALVLYNPVIDNGPGGYGYSTVQAYWQDISPLHNIGATAPPTVFFLGTNDVNIPVATGESYKALMNAQGIRCDLHLYEGQPHSFFNYDVPDDANGPFDGYRDTLFKTDEFLVSLGYLSDPYATPAQATAWVTIFGDAGFSGGSAATASPVTTDADGDSISANFSPVTLADGEFVRLTGSVTVNAPLSGDNFRIGLFDGDNPVTAGDGTGYAGIWASAPDTTAATISAGSGTGSSHPFESASSTALGPVPGAAATVPANTPVDFSLMIARNGASLDIAVSFSDHGSYNPSQNLLNQALTNYNFDSVAFLMSGNLNGTQASFSNVGIETGTVLPTAAPPVPSGLITYLVSDFIATREGAIDIQISGLPAGNYLFRSWHLDTITNGALGFAQGTTSTTPNTIEARIGGVLKDSVQPTSLGTAGLNTTFISNFQIPSLGFTFAQVGASPLTIELRSTVTNGIDNFLLLNGFEILQVNP